MRAGALDRRIQILRSDRVDDGYAEVETDWAPVGYPLWASRTDVSDGEKMQSQTKLSERMARFVVRSTSFTRTIASTDRLICEGLTFYILGVKELDRRASLEITASARSDRGSAR
ncbi:head-tail adaptor protein [Falsirhodobacter halotolerans]|uniref:head-tail adaptor protein n=1 Tax=Falsirhodobacter halotolerans TaxID=1146892 RepID=UPI001FD27971|nr:head-tail adaptor protein [Falsirhodobacter halotolerans]MCJ8139511.1 head-tail adaptor protein [Falsirhodobacter halotolerans]